MNTSWLVGLTAWTDHRQRTWHDTKQPARFALTGRREVDTSSRCRRRTMSEEEDEDVDCDFQKTWCVVVKRGAASSAPLPFSLIVCAPVTDVPLPLEDLLSTVSVTLSHWKRLQSQTWRSEGTREPNFPSLVPICVAPSDCGAASADSPLLSQFCHCGSQTCVRVMVSTASPKLSLHI